MDWCNLILAPCFAEYERALKSVSAEINYFELKETENFVLNVKNLETELENNYDLLILCNPNNPTGQFLKLKKLFKLNFSLCIYNRLILGK